MLDYIRELDHQLLIFINQLGNTNWDIFGSPLLMHGIGFRFFC